MVAPSAATAELLVHSPRYQGLRLAAVCSLAAVRFGGRHVYPSFSVQDAVVVLYPPTPSAQIADSALPVHIVPGLFLAVAHSPVVRTFAVGRTLAGRMVVACWAELWLWCRSWLRGEICRSAAIAMGLFRKAMVLPATAGGTVDVLLEIVHLLLRQRAKRSEC